MFTYGILFYRPDEIRVVKSREVKRHDHEQNILLVKITAKDTLVSQNNKVLDRKSGKMQAFLFGERANPF